MEAKLKELKERLIEINNLKSAVGVLHWDQATYMPPGGADARARQMATLEKLAHEMFIDPQIGKLLEQLKPYEKSLAFDSYEASLIRITRREYERAVKVPPSFQAELVAHGSKCFDVEQSPSGKRLLQGPILS